MTERRLHISEADFMLCLQVLGAKSLDHVINAVIEHQVQKQGTQGKAAAALGISLKTVSVRINKK